MTETPQIYLLLATISGEVGHVGKERRNQQQGYQFRGIDDVQAAVQPIMAKHGVVCVPRVVEREREVVPTTKGGTMNSVRLLVDHTFFAPDGSSVICTTLGEAMDSGDKATNKAMSAALKYALVETLMIPTYEADRDTEESSPEIKRPAPPRQAPRPQARELPADGRPGPGWDDVGKMDPRAGEAPRGQVVREGGRVSHGDAKTSEPPPRSTFTEKVEMSKQVFAGAREVDFPVDGEPDTATSEKLSVVLSRIYPGNDEDSQKLKSEWLCRQLGVSKVPKGKTARAIFDLRPLDDRVCIIAAAEAYEEQSRPAGWMSGAAPMETAVTKEGERE